MVYKTEIEDYNKEFNDTLPEVEVGETVKLFDVWDGNGETPSDSYTYSTDNHEMINYSFLVENPDDEPEEQCIIVTSIELI
jgi:hypothetical protein